MKTPQLTFFCELDAEPLQQLFSDPLLIGKLAHLQAGVSLGIIDLSTERAQVVTQLNQAGIPVTAWLLLPKDEGYWFNAGNAPLAVERYRQVKEWTDQNHLQWAAIGLDIEPDIREMQEISKNKTQLVRFVADRILNDRRLNSARRRYKNLVEEIHKDGYLVESYQFPFIEDERRAGSTTLQQITGLIDLPVDQEVWMLYSSFSPKYGQGLLGSYGPSAQAIGLGSTGGGVEIEGLVDTRHLNWDDLENDLILATQWTDQIYIFSLEGCVRQGFLDRISSVRWGQNFTIEPYGVRQVEIGRKLFRSALWTCAHPWIIPVSLAGLLWVRGLLRRRQ